MHQAAARLVRFPYCIRSNPWARSLKVFHVLAQPRFPLFSTMPFLPEFSEVNSPLCPSSSRPHPRDDLTQSVYAELLTAIPSVTCNQPHIWLFKCEAKKKNAFKFISKKIFDFSIYSSTFPSQWWVIFLKNFFLLNCRSERDEQFESCTG